MHECPRCGDVTRGSYSGGTRWTLCKNCMFYESMETDLYHDGMLDEGHSVVMEKLQTLCVVGSKDVIGVSVKYPEYNIWAAMKSRCLNPDNDNFKNYGGRGIKVCDAWEKSFFFFYKDMGKRPHKDLTLDRINNEGNYEPTNCRWTTRKIQRLNSRPRRCKIRVSNKLLGLELGLISHIKDFAEEFGLNQTSVYLCLRGVQEEHRGWTFERIT